MNERIFKLALKAMDFQGAVDIDTELKLTTSELAKFAELIVKECAEVAYKRSVHSCPSDIFKHFGVEE
jgi:hypothetical protein